MKSKDRRKRTETRLAAEKHLCRKRFKRLQAKIAILVFALVVVNEFYFADEPDYGYVTFPVILCLSSATFPLFATEIESARFWRTSFLKKNIQ